MAMKTSPLGLYAIAKSEGIVPAPYLDPVDVWTFGIGHAETSGLPPRPSQMQRGMPADMDAAFSQAVALFKQRIQTYEAAVNAAVTAPMAQHEFDALVSFHFNTGAIRKASATRVLNEGGPKTEVARRLALYNKAGGRKNQGLVNRRAEENEIFLHGNYPTASVPVWNVNANHKIDRVIRSIPKAEMLTHFSGKTSAPSPTNGLAGFLSWLLGKIFTAKGGPA